MRTGTSWWRETSSARQYLWVRHALVQGYRVEVNHQNLMVVQSSFHTWHHRSLCTNGTLSNCYSMLVRMKSWKTIISFQPWHGAGKWLWEKLRKGVIVLGRGKNGIYLFGRAGASMAVGDKFYGCSWDERHIFLSPNTFLQYRLCSHFHYTTYTMHGISH